MIRTRMSAEKRKLAIVQAALPLFARRGFAETTTKDLAKAAGVSEPLLYKHFPSKEALYLEIQNFCCRNSDPINRRLDELEPGAASLVRLTYLLLRSLILGLPSLSVEWETRQRLMLNSLLHDGAFARLIYKNRFDVFCARMESCLEAAVAAGDAVQSPATPGNRARFAHHIGAWIALAHLPETSAINYRTSREKLLDEAVWFALRGMGLTDEAIAKHYKPRALEAFFDETQSATEKTRPARNHSSRD